MGRVRRHQGNDELLYGGGVAVEGGGSMPAKAMAMSPRSNPRRPLVWVGRGRAGTRCAGRSDGASMSSAGTTNCSRSSYHGTTDCPAARSRWPACVGNGPPPSIAEPSSRVPSSNSSLCMKRKLVWQDALSRTSFRPGSHARDLTPIRHPGSMSMRCRRTDGRARLTAGQRIGN